MIHEGADRSSELPNPIVLAHELRSHLAAVTLGTSHVRRRLTTDDLQVWRALDIIDRAASRATELTSWILATSTEPLPEPTEPIELDDPPERRRAHANGHQHIPTQGLARPAEVQLPLT